MAKGIKRRIGQALKKVNGEVSAMARHGGRYAGGLASEGYAGGYAQALRDVLLLLDGVEPNTRTYWEKTLPKEKSDA